MTVADYSLCRTTPNHKKYIQLGQNVVEFQTFACPQLQRRFCSNPLFATYAVYARNASIFSLILIQLAVFCRKILNYSAWGPNKLWPQAHYCRGHGHPTPHPPIAPPMIAEHLRTSVCDPHSTLVEVVM